MSGDYALRPCKGCENITRNKVFCSKLCNGKYRTRQGIAKYLEIGIFPTNPWTAKRYLIKLYGQHCSICKLSEWLNTVIPLVLDHIDGNSDNWAIENLRLVCGNCDMQLPTYKGRNKGNGRFTRRQRYAEGKSY